MKKLRRVGICLLVVILALSLFGCGAGNTNAQNSTANNNKEVTSATDTTTNTASGEVKKITFWDYVWGPSEYLSAAKDLVARFNSENTDNIEVTYQSISWSDGYEKFVAAIAANTPPDVSTGGGFSQHQFAAMGQIMSLDSIIDEWTKDGSIDDFFPGLIDNFKYNGEQIGIPWNVDSRAIYYRKDMFEQAGITTLPTTWDELLEAGKKLSNDEHYGMIFALQDNASDHPMQTFMASNGSGYFDESGNLAFDNEKNVQVLDFIEKMVTEGVIPKDVVSTTQSAYEKMFFTGKVAIIIGATDFPEIARSEMGDDFVKNIGLLPPVKGYSGGGFSPMNPNAIMVFNKTKYPEECKTFIKWFSNNNQSLWTDGKVGAMPARKSVFEVFNGDEFKTQFRDVLLSNAVTQTYPYPSAKPSMNGIESSGCLREALQEALSTDKDHKAILSDLQKNLQELVDDMDK